MNRAIDYSERWRKACGHDASRIVLREAALDMIRSNGLEDFNMRALAKHIGLSPMAAYRYYESKDILIDDIRYSITLSFSIYLKDAASISATPTVQFADMCDAYVDFALRNEQDYWLMFGSLSSPTGPNAVTLEKAASWKALLDILRRMDVISESELQDKAHLIWSALHGLVMLHISRRLVLGRTIDQIMPRLKEMLIGAAYAPRG